MSSFTSSYFSNTTEESLARGACLHYTLFKQNEIWGRAFYMQPVHLEASGKKVLSCAVVKLENSYRKLVQESTTGQLSEIIICICNLSWSEACYTKFWQ